LSDIFSALSSAYASAAAQSLFPIGSKFVNVDPTLYQGTWTGKDDKNQSFSLSITNVQGYRANVLFRSASGIQNQRVYITANNSFRIGDSRFTLTKVGVAEVKTVTFDDTAGTQTIVTAQATLQT
jgi:hypothetical protein